MSYGWGSNAPKYVETVLRDTGMKVLVVETFGESLEEGQASRIADLIEGTIGQASRSTSPGPPDLIRIVDKY
ncbi:MAG: hypothetical protein ACP5G6_08585 [Conexivisphaera sp.]